MGISLDELLTNEPMGREGSQQYRSILRHALKHFSQRGYAGTNVRAIAADASVSAPMINYYFETKEALHNEVVQIVMVSLNDLVWRDFPADAAFEEQARHLIAKHAEFARAHHDALGLILGLVYGPSDGRPSVDLAGLYGETLRRTRQIVEDAVGAGRLNLHQSISTDAAVRALEDAINRVCIRTWERQFPDAKQLTEDALGIMLVGIRDR
jgi:AcrR family transcriptional regulator